MAKIKLAIFGGGASMPLSISATPLGVGIGTSIDLAHSEVAGYLVGRPGAIGYVIERESGGGTVRGLVRLVTDYIDGVPASALVGMTSIHVDLMESVRSMGGSPDRARMRVKLFGRAHARGSDVVVWDSEERAIDCWGNSTGDTCVFTNGLRNDPTVWNARARLFRP